MVKTEFKILELRDEHIDPTIPREKVFWFSRHPLTEDQEQAIYYLHHKNVQVRHSSKIVFASSEHLASVIKHYSQEGIVYVVAPNWMVDQVRVESSRLVFRTFHGYLDQKERYVFLSIHEVHDGFSHSIFSQSQLEKFQLREKIESIGC